MIPDFAPGCFGSALTFDAADMICRNCAFSAQCKPASALARRALQDRFGIKVREKKTNQVVQEDGTVELALPIKTQKLIERIDNSNLDVVGNLSRGKNPFDGTMKFLAVACQLLLRRPVVSRELLIAGCVYALKCQQNTAEAYARQAEQILAHIGAVDVTEGGIKLKGMI
jgi:hypothetical protein